jgi:hypothetical protein
MEAPESRMRLLYISGVSVGSVSGVRPEDQGFVELSVGRVVLGMVRGLESVKRRWFISAGRWTDREVAEGGESRGRTVDGRPGDGRWLKWIGDARGKVRGRVRSADQGVVGLRTPGRPVKVGDRACSNSFATRSPLCYVATPVLADVEMLRCCDVDLLWTGTGRMSSGLARGC